MIRLSLIASLALVISSCTSRSDLFVSWTIDGFPAAEACKQFEDASMRFRVVNRDGDADVEEIATAPCADGQAKLSVAPQATIFADLLEGSDVYGGDTVTVQTNAYEGSEADAPVALNIQLTRGRLAAKLRVVGDKCGEAGASTFTVTLNKSTSPLGNEVVAGADGVSVSCPGGDADAVFEFKPVDIGSRYEVFATTTIDGVEYATDDAGTGEGVIIENGLTDLTVDLDVVERP